MPARPESRNKAGPLRDTIMKPQYPSGVLAVWMTLATCRESRSLDFTEYLRENFSGLDGERNRAFLRTKLRSALRGC
jgi:hypothetical protein